MRTMESPNANEASPCPAGRSSQRTPFEHGRARLTLSNSRPDIAFVSSIDFSSRAFAVLGHRPGIRVGWASRTWHPRLSADHVARGARGEWWFLGLERAVPRLVEAGAVSESDAATALEQMRAPGFAMLGPTSIATIGRKPATTEEQP